MALQIKWTRRADKKFDVIIAYLLENWNEGVTKRFVKKVYDFLEILFEFPEIGTCENKEKGIRGYPIVKQINIFYRINGETIIVLDFFDNRQNPKKSPF